MTKAQEYRQHARECRNLAAAMGAYEHRELMLDMAATWERMAEEREGVESLDEQRSFKPKPAPRGGRA